MKNKYLAIGAAALCILFLAWKLFGGFSPSAIRVLDARVTFKFTALQDNDQYFISYSLENTKKKKVKADVRVQLGSASLGGRVFHALKARNDTAVLEPLESKTFVAQIDIPKPKNGKDTELDVRVKVKRVSRA